MRRRIGGLCCGSINSQGGGESNGVELVRNGLGMGEIDTKNREVALKIRLGMRLERRCTISTSSAPYEACESAINRASRWVPNELESGLNDGVLRRPTREYGKGGRTQGLG